MDTSAKKRIIIGINDLCVGGGQRLVVDVLKQGAFQDAEVHIITLVPNTKGVGFISEVPDNIVIHHVDVRYMYDVLGLFSLFSLLRKLKPEVVWTHFFLPNTVFRLLQPLLGYCVIITEHNTYTWKKRRHRILDKILSYLTYRVVTVSEQVAEFTAAQESISRAKFTVIPNGVDIARIQSEAEKYNKEAAKEQLGLPADKKYIVNVSRLVEQKNHALLIDAFAQFAQTHPDHDLLIVGSGPLKEGLGEQAALLGLGERIHLLGTRNDVAVAYRASDFFVLTSYIEGFALVCIEAMAAGIPVLAPEVAGPNEYIKDGENGYFITYEPQEVAQKMELLANEIAEKSDAFASATRATAEQYDIKKTASQYRDLFFGKSIF